MNACRIEVSVDRGALLAVTKSCATVDADGDRHLSKGRVTLDCLDTANALGVGVITLLIERGVHTHCLGRDVDATVTSQWKPMLTSRETSGGL